MTEISIRIQSDIFSTSKEIETFQKNADPDLGATVTFTGRCRSEDGRLTALYLEHYPGMAEAQLQKIAEDAATRWDLIAITIVHRFGHIPVGDDIVLVLASASHRAAAFSAADFVMDFLKNSAPFWKKEITNDDQDSKWVEAKQSDDEALKRWSKETNRI